MDWIPEACTAVIDYWPVITGTLAVLVAFEVTGFLTAAIIVRRRRKVVLKNENSSRLLVGVRPPVVGPSGPAGNSGVSRV